MPFSLPVDTGPSIKDFTSFSWAFPCWSTGSTVKFFWGLNYLRVFLVNDEHVMNQLCIELIINYTWYVSYVTIRTIFQHISTRFNLKDSPLSICWLHINNQVKRHFDRIPTPLYSEDQLGSVVNNHGDRKSPNWRCTNSFRWPNTMASKWG